ncbi:cytochrome c biogenesis protein CcdA [Pseudonocardia dioxanivorans]|uniref:cytochrome c biogenesis protein CcdA n=1 Tax=Pseudonocardia dioxanivorans TaxID=240495 RepID=UPI000CD14C0E|nr:cation transporter [Pseudonocardia dioxanivorans]
MDDTAAPTTEAASRQLDIPVFGMSCSSCSSSITLALSGLPGVHEVGVDLADNRVRVTGPADQLDETRVRAEIEHAGYHLDAPPSPTPRRRGRWVLIGTGVLGVFVAGLLAFQVAAGRYYAPGALADLNATFAEPSVGVLGLALVFGLLVGFAPSTLAMAPVVVGYVGGARARSLPRALGLSGSFVAGMIAVDIALGAVFALAGRGALRVLGAGLPVWYAIVTVLLVVLALLNFGLWRSRLPSLTPRRGLPSSPWGAFALGVPFGLVTCPACTPLLLPIALGAAATADPVYGAVLLGAFALGRGLPLIALGASGRGMTLAQRGATLMPWLKTGLGVLLLVAAAYFFYRFLAIGGLSSLL